jgi:electron transfer flavoprotein alpha subunit
VSSPLGRFVALVDGTAADGPRQARALAAFVHGLPATAGAAAATGETVVFCADPAAGRELADLAPTRDVRLVAAPARRPDVMVDRLLALGGPAHLYLAGPGPAGAELVARLACRTGGSALDGVLELRLAGESAQCRRSVYSGHLVGSFELRRRPWCLSLDASWDDRRWQPLGEHRVRADHTGEGAPSAEPFADVELLAPAAADDLAEARFVVIAGYGAGREGVSRLAAAARRMGAAFGVSRPVAMNAWAPLDRLVGASGARTAPLACVVAAASGAPALYWGIERATWIAAVNTDDRAPIVRSADAVVIDDGVAVIEALAAIVEERRGA